jgi:hypothetical protein
MAFYDKIFEFITNRSNSLSAKATIVILTLFTIFIADNIIGFSYYYNKDKQLEQLKSITFLLKESSISSENRKYLINLESETLNRKDIVDYSSLLFENISEISSAMSQKTINNKDSVIRNDFWFLISTSGIYILVTVLILPIILLTDRKTPFLKLVATLLIFSLVMIFTTWFNYWLFDKIIPNQIFGSWIFNYILNFILQISLMYGLYWATNNINKINER